MSKIEFFMLRHQTSIFTACFSGMAVCFLILLATTASPYGQPSRFDQSKVPTVIANVGDFANEVPTTVRKVGDFTNEVSTNYVLLLGNLVGTAGNSVNSAITDLNPASLDISFFPIGNEEPDQPTGCHN